MNALRTLLLVSVLLWVPELQAQQPLFERQALNLGYSFSTKISADFDGDGDIDFLGNGDDQSSIFVRAVVNDGSGSFSLRTLIDGGPSYFTARETGNAFDELIFADLNLDGAGDIAVVKRSGHVNFQAVQLVIEVYLNDGRGNFSLAFTQPLDPGAQTGPNRLGIGNANSDHVLDLIFLEVTANETRIRVFLGLGNGAFLELPAQVLPQTTNASSALFGDFQNDGLTDVFFDRRVLFNTGNGVFLESQQLPLVWAELRDLNADGFPDLAAEYTDTFAPLNIFFNNGVGQFYPVTSEFKPDFGAMFVSNGNAGFDLLSVERLPGTETAQIAIRFLVDGGFSIPYSAILGPVPSTPFQNYPFASVATGEVDRKDQPELFAAFGFEPAYISHFTRDTFGNYHKTSDYTLDGSYTARVSELVDLDLDGDLDLPVQFSEKIVDPSPIIGGTRFPVYFQPMLNDGTGNFTFGDPLALVEGAGSPGKLDFNLDSAPDLYFFSDHISNRGVRSSSLVVLMNQNTAPAPRCSTVISGDYNGDAQSDHTVTRSYGAGLYWFHAFSFGSVEGPLLFGLSQFDTPLPADYDGDGKYNRGVVRDWFGRLDWYYESKGGSAIAQQWGLSGDIPLVGRFSQSCKPALVAVRENLGGLDWYVSTNNPTFTAFSFGLAGGRPFVADVNGDGSDDFIVAHQELGGIVWYARGNEGQFYEVIPWGLVGDELLPPMDLNADGRADFIVARNVNGFKYLFVRYGNSTETEILSFGLANDSPFIFQSRLEGSLVGMYRETPSGFSEVYLRRKGPHGSTTLERRQFGLSGDTFVLPKASGGSFSSNR